MLTAWPSRAAFDLELARYSRLWCAVVERAVLDALGLALGNAAYEGRAAVIGRARTWLDKPSADRDAVLDHAGLSPATVERSLARLHALWAMADTGTLDPGVTGGRGRPRRCFGGGRKRKR